jgi:hypothetical protein
MAMNLDAIKKKLTQLQSSTQKQDRLWKPEAGKTVIRIVPYQFDKENPFSEMYFHYDLGKKTFLSPFTYGNPDPIVEFAEKLKKTGSSDDWKMGKKLEPKMRTYVPIIVRGKESEGVKYWGFGKQIYQEILNILTDEDYGDITDLKNGRDIVVEFQKAEDAGNTYGKISIRVKPNATPATDNKEIFEKILNGQKDLKEIFPEPSYDDLKTALQEWLNPSEESDEEDTPKPAVKASPATKAKKTDDVSAAFEELFDEE